MYDDGRPVRAMDTEVAHIKPKQVYMLVYARSGGDAVWQRSSGDGSNDGHVAGIVVDGGDVAGAAGAQDHGGQAGDDDLGASGGGAQRRKKSPAVGGERARVAQRSGRASGEPSTRVRVLRRTDACLMPPTYEDFERWGAKALWRGDVDDSVDWLAVRMARVGLGDGGNESSGAAAASHVADGASADETDPMEDLADDLARSHLDVETRGTGGEQGEAKRLRTDAAVEEWRKYTPTEIDATKCMARTWGNGSGGQCARKPEAGCRFCVSHKKKEGKPGWHGAVDGEIPAEKLAEFRTRGKPRVLAVEMRGQDGGRADGARSAVSADGASLQAGVSTGQADVAGMDRAAGQEAVSRVGGPRIVSGFGRERIEDVASHGRRLDRETLARAASRRAEGSRGRMTGFDGEDLDRAAGGPWQAGRR